MNDTSNALTKGAERSGAREINKIVNSKFDKT